MKPPALLETARTFRARLRARERLAGTFVKSLSYPAIEVLATSGLDFVVIDAEHAPYGRADLDRSLLAAAAYGFPAIVRVPSIEWIAPVLDCGAAGILAPHIRSGDHAHALAAACRYREGTRGFSNSPRAGNYGRMGLETLVASADDAVAVIAQIEDADALAQLDAIMDAPVDACFIGRADLAVSCGASGLSNECVAEATARIAAAARATRMPLAIFVGTPAELHEHERLGATAFVIGSDLGLMRSAAAEVAARFAAAV